MIFLRMRRISRSEFGDINNILAYISIGDHIQDIERLVGALADIRRLYERAGKRAVLGRVHYANGCDYAAEGVLCGERGDAHPSVRGPHLREFVMCYPPGIPILAPGEIITEDIIDYIQYAQEKGQLDAGAGELRYIDAERIERRDILRWNSGLKNYIPIM